jgi:hypothetical protein
MSNIQSINLNFSNIVEVVNTFSDEQKCLELLEKNKKHDRKYRKK